jgi:shikimate dehydrogenase
VRSALILGGGGTAAAVLAALAELGTAEVVIAGRRPSSSTSAVAVAETLGLPIRVIGWDVDVVAAAGAGADLVVSTVPAGGADHFASALSAVPVLFDVIYHPWPTPLAAGGVPGRITVTGLDMLLHQAFRQFELITGVTAPRAAMREGLKAGSGTDLPLPI